MSTPRQPFARCAPVSFVYSIWRSRDLGGAVLALCLAGYALFPLALAVVPSSSLVLMARFHLRSASFPAWWAAQLSPWMYNFENRFVVSPRLLAPEELERLPSDLHWEAANHQPARAFTFADGRARFLAGAGTRYFYLESRYQQYRMTTAYRVRIGEAHATVTLLEAP